MTPPDRQALMTAREALTAFHKIQPDDSFSDEWKLNPGLPLTLGDLRRASRALILIDAALAEAGPATGERDTKDYAVEFGEYLAKAAEAYMRFPLANGLDRALDAYRALRSAVYEFRKRADCVIPAAPVGTGTQVGDLIERVERAGARMGSFQSPDGSFDEFKAAVRALDTAIDTLTREMAEWRERARQREGEADAYSKRAWAAESTITELRKERDRLQDANAISDRIVGELNTEVMALEDTIVELRAQLEARPTTASGDDRRRMEWLLTKTVNVRQPLPHGSRDMFWASPEPDEEDVPSDLREKIDAALAVPDKTGERT